MGTEELKQKLGWVHAAREEYGRRRSIRLELEDDFQREHQAVFDAEFDAKDALEKAELDIRQDAVAAFQADPFRRKDLCPGLAIKIQHEYEYEFEVEAALKWAKETGLCLLLDTKGFKKVCQTDSIRPPFVTEREIAQAQIATDLGKVLEVAP